MIKNKFCINLESAKRIENYESALLEDFKKWQIHHRLETHNSDGEKRLVQLTREELKALDMYYFRPPEELIFLKWEEHTRIHSKGHICSESQKRKVSATLKGHIVTAETRNKISMKLKGFEVSEETKKKIAEASRKNMEIKKKLYHTQYKGKMTWNEFQSKIKC